MLDGVFGDGYGIAYAVAGFRRENVYASALTYYLQLIDRVWALKVGGN